MILIVEAENSNILLGCADELTGEIRFENRISSDLRKTSVEYSIIIKQIIELNSIALSEITGGIIASCVPGLTDTLKTAMTKLLHTSILEVGPGIKTGVDIRIDDPGELGADLIATAAAGIIEYGAPLVIINLCTLTTISVINEKKHFIGAIFQPGLHISAEAMRQRAASLPDIAIRRSEKLIGTNTVESIQSGIINGCAAAIDGLLDRIIYELDYPDLLPVITGEHAQTIASGCKHHMLVDEHLVIKGLISIYKKNKKIGGLRV